jgi:hypothetical protein
MRSVANGLDPAPPSKWLRVSKSFLEPGAAKHGALSAAAPCFPWSPFHTHARAPADSKTGAVPLRQALFEVPISSTTVCTAQCI